MLSLAACDRSALALIDTRCPTNLSASHAWIQALCAREIFWSECPTLFIPVYPMVLWWAPSSGTFRPGHRPNKCGFDSLVESHMLGSGLILTARENKEVCNENPSIKDQFSVLNWKYSFIIWAVIAILSMYYIAKVFSCVTFFFMEMSIERLMLWIASRNATIRLFLENNMYFP